MGKYDRFTAMEYAMMYGTNGATAMMPEPPMLCVGGPMHGEQIVQKGSYVQMPVAMSNPWAADLRVFSTSYEKDYVEVRYGALILTGYFWRWQHMDRDKAAPAALGLIMASAIQGSR